MKTPKQPRQYNYWRAQKAKEDQALALFVAGLSTIALAICIYLIQTF